MWLSKAGGRGPRAYRQPVQSSDHGCGPRVAVIQHEHMLLRQGRLLPSPPFTSPLPAPAITSKHSPNKSFPATFLKRVPFQLDQLPNLSHHVSAPTLPLAARGGNKELNIAGDERGEGKKRRLLFTSSPLVPYRSAFGPPPRLASVQPSPGRTGEQCRDLPRGHEAPQTHLFLCHCHRGRRRRT